jgi:hypothetical protein
MRSSLYITHILDFRRTGCSAEATVKISFFPYTNFMHQGRQDYTVQQAQIAFVEMWLLSFSDVLLTSPYSTFGYIPQGNVIIQELTFSTHNVRAHAGAYNTLPSAWKVLSL